MDTIQILWVVLLIKGLSLVMRIFGVRTLSDIFKLRETQEDSKTKSIDELDNFNEWKFFQ